MNRQRGMTFISLVLMVAGIVFVAVIGMKLAPVYIEYFTIKRAFASLKTQMDGNSLSNKQIVEAFQRQQTIDRFESITSKDLVISDSASGKVVSVEYSVVKPLVGNVSALIDFTVSTDASAETAE